MHILDTIARIRSLNDIARQCPFDMDHYMSRGIASLPPADQAAILERVRTFDDFNDDNDPWREHDFGSFLHKGRTIFWKIDYYDLYLKNGSSDPSDPVQTRRVLTVMFAEEY